MRHVYFYSKSLDKVNEALEDAFAWGEICWGEDPQIEKRGKFWVLTVRG